MNQKSTNTLKICLQIHKKNSYQQICWYVMSTNNINLQENQVAL